jgi:hypothetical protein
MKNEYSRMSAWSIHGGSCARFCNFNCDAQLFANAVIYGLVQSGLR